ncbi:PadR family transcriptional regulator [Nonomuraea rubra]|uniref:PadR family transcriptional regulator n=1 Tax=Nonomuraea rubra TaxID=46180 RepID=UPI0031EB5E63
MRATAVIAEARTTGDIGAEGAGRARSRSTSGAAARSAPGGPWGGGHAAGAAGAARPSGATSAPRSWPLLSEEPRNGYQIIQEIAERSEGGWKPSPGAVYPALQQLTDEGLVISEENEGRKTFRLTEEGRNLHRGARRRGPRPWDEMRPDIDDNTADLWHIARQSAFAMMQVLQTGNGRTNPRSA